MKKFKGGKLTVAKNKKHMTRRRVIRLMGSMAATGLGLSCMSVSAGAQNREAVERLHQWQGRLMGAEVSIQLFHTDADLAKDIIQNSVRLIRKLERSFSLFDPDSALSLLNKQGFLENPDADFFTLLTRSQEISALTKGAFDMSVQPLWLHYKRYGTGNKKGLEAARALVGYDKILLSPQRVEFAQKGMALTMNGIAQGYITDKVVAYLKQRGVKSTLVDMGEYAALGPQPDGSPWRIALVDPFQAGALAEIMELDAGAVSTSGAYGDYFDKTSHLHHLFDPREGKSANRYAAVTVQAPEALLADALSTAFYCMSEYHIKKILQSFDSKDKIKARLTLLNGEIHHIENL